MEVCEGTGILARPTKDFGVISANIGGSPEKLQFTRRVFFSFGIPCEGSLNNILEEGMEVDFCYRLSSGKPHVVAVWLGDKPELTNILYGVYSQSGRVCQVRDDHYLIQTESMPHTVIINRDFVHAGSSVLAVGNDVRFDAMPLVTKHDSGAVFQGTCAWIGNEPTLANRFGLALSEALSLQDTAEVHNNNHVHGTVVVIPCDTVAIVEVMGFRKKGLLFRCSFHDTCERLQDNIRVGDTVCMIIRSRCKLWLAAKAYKECFESRQPV